MAGINPKPKVYVEQDYHAALQRLAAEDHRGLGTEIEWLIGQEFERRQWEPPKRAVGNGRKAKTAQLRGSEPRRPYGQR